MFKEILSIFLGGIFGSILRYLIEILIKKYFNIKFDIETILCNFLGCFLIGTFSKFSDFEGIHKLFFLLISVGFCGSLTTFSTYAHSIMFRIENKEFIYPILEIFITIIGCLSFVILGFKISLNFKNFYIKKIINEDTTTM